MTQYFGWFAEDVARGWFKQQVRGWTIEGLRAAAAQDAGLPALQAAAPQAHDTLLHMAGHFREIRDLSFGKMLQWAEQANPKLVEQALAEPEVARYLRKAFEAAKAELLRTKAES